MSWRAALPFLVEPHIHYSDGVHWQLTQRGVSINAQPAVGTPGEPATVRRVWRWYGPSIAAAARAHNVPCELIVATICTETAGSIIEKDACDRARRTEPGWVSDVMTPNRVSIGCMQTLVSTAIAVTPYIPHLTALMLQNPSVSIDAGTAAICDLFSVHRFDPPLMAACFNAGGLFFESAEANRWRLRCYPSGTGAYIDRFIAWFNDAMCLPEAAMNANGAPAFAHLPELPRSPVAVGA